MRTGAMIQAPKFKPSRDRHVSVIAVDCPSCGVKAGEHCRRVDGTPSPGHLQHSPRRRLAVRADNLSRSTS